MKLYYFNELDSKVQDFARLQVIEAEEKDYKKMKNSLKEFIIHMPINYRVNERYYLPSLTNTFKLIKKLKTDSKYLDNFICSNRIMFKKSGHYYRFSD